MPGNLYDALILGGGPAGLSAAVYLGRFTRSVVVLDAGAGRSSFQQKNENYLGFPEGVTTRELRELGRRQAERFGVAFRETRVERAEVAGEDAEGRPVYRVSTTDGDFEGRGAGHRLRERLVPVPGRVRGLARLVGVDRPAGA